jgi:hypothetical protein
MSIAELRQLPSKEKMRIIEMLWSDLASGNDEISSPDWHGEELRKTDADFAAGRVEVLDWQQAKKELRGRFE